MDPKLQTIIDLLKEAIESKDPEKLDDLSKRVEESAVVIQEIIKQGSIANKPQEYLDKVQEIRVLLNDLTARQETNEQIFLQFQKYLETQKIN